MGKVKYLTKRIFNMSFKNYFKVINDVHERTGKSRLYILLDSMVCGLKYQAGYMDYQLFEMYKMNSDERKTIVTRGKNNEIIKKYNDKNYIKYFEDKTLFNDKFNKYLNRDWMMINDKNFDKFDKFITKNKTIVVKPIDGTCGKGVEKIITGGTNKRKLFDTLLQNGQLLIEEVAKQCKSLSALHPTSINTVRLVTLKGQVVAAFLRIGNFENVVDNLNNDGLAAPIDNKIGTIKYPAMDKEHNVYKIHPVTNEKIIGFKIPKWKEVLKLCKSACKEIPEVGYVGWDVCIGEDKPFLIEGNDFPGHDIYQLPPHRDGNIGLYPIFEKIMKGDEK